MLWIQFKIMGIQVRHHHQVVAPNVLHVPAVVIVAVHQVVHVQVQALVLLVRHVLPVHHVLHAHHVQVAQVNKSKFE